MGYMDMCAVDYPHMFCMYTYTIFIRMYSTYSAHSCGLNPLLLEVHSKIATDNMI